MWTPELKETARRLRSSGVSNGEIAKAVGKTPNAVSLFITREMNREPGVRSVKRPTGLTESEIAHAVAARDKGRSFQAIGAELHRDPQTVSAVLRSMGYAAIHHRYTQEQDDIIRALYPTGCAIGEIAAAIGSGVSLSAISNRVAVLGLDPRARAKKPKIRTKRKPDQTRKNLVPWENGSWDSRLTLPWHEWRKWKQEQRKQMQQERAA